MTCDEFEPLLAAHALGSLETSEAAPLRTHLRTCAACRATAGEYRAAVDLLPLAVDPVAPPPSLRSALLAQVHAEARAAAGGRAQRRSWLRRAWARVPTGRGVTTGIGAGALAAAMVAVLSLTVLRTAAPVTQPPHVAARACGLTAQPGVSCTLSYDASARQASLVVSGLARIRDAGGQPTGTYEVWVITPDRRPHPAAYLSLQPDGVTWTATLRGDMTGYVAMAATLEPPGGSATPSGTEVLRLDLPLSSSTS